MEGRPTKSDFHSYVFPSDTHLLSKAETGTGWSTKGSRELTDIRLSTDEERAILDVIRRNEELALKDHDRIEALLSRYEMYKQIHPREMRESSNSCSLCKKRSPTQIQCGQCALLICRQCSTRLDQQPLPCPGRSNSLFWWHSNNDQNQDRKNSFSSVPGNKERSESLISPQAITLCHICYEEREVWKKTGAWFYKRIPKVNRSSPNSPNPLKRRELMSNKNMSISVINKTTEQKHLNEEENSSLANETDIKYIKRTGVIVSNKNQTSKLVTSRRTSFSTPIPLPPNKTMREAPTKQEVPKVNEVKKTIKKENDENKDPLDIENAPFGTLHFSLHVDSDLNVINIKIHRAKNLIAMDSNGLSDPYIIIMIKPYFKFRTETIPQNLNPIWNETFQITINDIFDRSDKLLRLAVLDEDMFGSDWLGEYQMTLEKLPYGQTMNYFVPLAPRKLNLARNDEIEFSNRGKIHLALQYLSDCRQLRIDVIRCAELAPMDQNGLSDPFVKLYLRPDKSRKTKQKTVVKRATLFPEYHETFYYDLNLTDALKRTLEVTVWDFDRGPKNDFIGGLNLGCSAKAERREVWLAVFRPPYRRFEAWFQLSSRTGSAYPEISPKHLTRQSDSLISEDIILIHQGGTTPGIKN